MLKRLLIANRGEIAVRIMRACRELGIETVAVYSDADARRAARPGRRPGRPHRTRAAARELPATPRPSSTRRSGAGADAVHPGLRLPLRERAFFARACDDAGLIFVGPPSTAIERMGSKIGARRLMQAAGVPVVPGETPPDESDAGAARRPPSASASPC